MAVDYRLVIKELQGLENFYVFFAQTTRMPYVECDQETFDDQVYLFKEEEEAKKWAEEYKEKQIPLTTVKVGKEQMLMFYTSLYLVGVNRLVFRNGAGAAYLSYNIVFFKNGEIVDQGDRKKILNDPDDPYTKKLLDAVPVLGGNYYV